MMNYMQNVRPEYATDEHVPWMNLLDTWITKVISTKRVSISLTVVRAGTTLEAMCGRKKGVSSAIAMISEKSPNDSL